MTLRKKDTLLPALALVLALAGGQQINHAAVQTANNLTSLAVPASVPQGTTIKIDGSLSMAMINETLKSRFESSFPGSKVEITYGSTANALKALREGKVDLVALGRPLATKDKEGLVVRDITRSKIALVVSEKNTFSGSITDRDFAKIFRGEIRNWSRLGGPNRVIRVIDRPDTSDTRATLGIYSIFEGAPFKTGRNVVKLKEDSTAEMVKNLGRNGIGYAILDQVENLPNVKILAVFKTLPNDPKYPFSQPLAYAYKGPEPNDRVKAFLGYATAKDNQGIVEEARKKGAIDFQDGKFDRTNAPQEDKTQDTASQNNQAANNSPTATGDNETAKNTANQNNQAVNNSPDAKGDNETAKNTASQNNQAVNNSPTATGDNETAKNTASQATKPAIKSPEAKSDDKTAKNSGSQETKTTNNATQGQGNDTTAKNNASREPKSKDNVLVPSQSSNRDSEMPWWFWLLPIPLLGALLWALLGSRDDDDKEVVIPQEAVATAVGGVGTSEPQPKNRIILVSRNCREGYVYWEVDQTEKEELQRKGGEKLALRLYDVTEKFLDDPSLSHVQELECNPNDVDCHIKVPQDDRDYVVELGYITAGYGNNSGKWLKLVRSSAIHFPVCPPSDDLTIGTTATPNAKENLSTSPIVTPTISPIAPIITTGTAIAAATIPSTTVTYSQPQPEPNRLILVARNCKETYAYWEIEPQANRQLMLRLFDITHQDIDDPTIQPVQQIHCAPNTQDLHLSVPLDNRDYIADLGYFTGNEWHLITRSPHIRVPECPIAPPENLMPLSTEADSNGFESQPKDNTAALNQQTVTLLRDDFLQRMATNASQVGMGVAGTVATATAGVMAIGHQQKTDSNNLGTNIDTAEPMINDLGPVSRVIITPRHFRDAYVYWEINEQQKEAAKIHQGGQHLTLRICDVTDLVDVNYPNRIMQYSFAETVQDHHISVPDSGDYIAEVGYMTEDDHWIKLASSTPIQIPANF